MDSLTQFVLGAAVGEALLGRQVGRKALWWGAAAGTLPDLDVLGNAFLTDVEALLFHRGYSHSLFFALPVAPLLAWLAITLHGRGSAPFLRWANMFFWCLFTHPLLDIFTNYGTQLFYPLWDERIAFNTISIVDPLYTLPLLVAFLAVLILRDRERRWKWTLVCLMVSHVYLSLTTLNKWHIQRVALSNAGDSDRVFTSPALFTNILWNVIVEKDDHYLAGYYGMMDSDEEINFITIPKNRPFELPYQTNEEFQALRQFSKGYYTLVQDKELVFRDLRFGPSGGWQQPDTDYIFSFTLTPAEGGLLIQRKPPEMRGGDTLKRLFERIKGD